LTSEFVIGRGDTDPKGKKDQGTGDKNPNALRDGASYRKKLYGGTREDRDQKEGWWGTSLPAKTGGKRREKERRKVKKTAGRELIAVPRNKKGLGGGIRGEQGNRVRVRKY